VLPLSPSARFEAGYLMVHLNRATDVLVHAPAVNFYFTPKR
jgi:hypothetical protein